MYCNVKKRRGMEEEEGGGGKGKETIPSTLSPTSSMIASNR